MFRAKRHTQTLTLISILCAKWMKKKEKKKTFICDSRNAKSENNVQRAAVGQEKKKSGQQRPTKVFYLSSHNFMLWFSIFEWISSADQTKKSCIVECLHKNSLLNSSNSVPCLFYSHVSHVCFGDWRLTFGRTMQPNRVRLAQMRFTTRFIYKLKCFSNDRSRACLSLVRT